MRTNVYIDASNLFYGGVKSLGWKVDYEKLLEYFKEKYSATRVFFFGGVEVYGFPFDYLKEDTVAVDRLEIYLGTLIKEMAGSVSVPDTAKLSGYLKRARFYLKLESFGYELVLKPVKTFFETDGSSVRKANCDVEMSLCLISDQDMFDRVVVLSGDGDFLPVLKVLRENGKEVVVLARGSRTAKEIRRFAAEKFLDFEYLRERLKCRDR